jgi:hypothetical protein
MPGFNSETWARENVSPEEARSETLAFNRSDWPMAKLVFVIGREIVTRNAAVRADLA